MTVARSTYTSSFRFIYAMVVMALVTACAIGEGPTRHAPPAVRYEGYGSVAVGGVNGDVYRVTSLEDDGSGTLRHGIVFRKGPRTIVFDVAGAITLKRRLVVRMPYLTIAGETAPPPGITIQQKTMHDEFIIGGTHDIIVRHLRFRGVYVAGGPTRNNAATIGIDGDSRPDRVAQRIVLDHLTVRGSVDGGPDVWGEVRDVTISWSFFFHSAHPTTISHHPKPFQARQRISMHHNVYAKNGERNPQVRADVHDLDLVNNVVYDWGYFGGWGYGVRVRNEPGEPKVHANFINNYLIPRSVNPAWGLVYGIRPGPDPADGAPSGPPPPQGTVMTTTRLGQLWVSGNILPEQNQDHYSTVPAPLPVPPAAQVTTWPASELRTEVLPHVGMMYRDREEQSILDELANAMSPKSRHESYFPVQE